MSNLYNDIDTFTKLQNDLSIIRILNGFLYAKYAAGGPPIE